MTLREYIALGEQSITQIGLHLGVSEHAVRKWAYGQREPDIDMAVSIEELTGGKVTVPELSRTQARGEGQAA